MDNTMNNEMISYGHPSIQAFAYALGYVWDSGNGKNNDLEYEPEINEAMIACEEYLSKVTLADLGNYMNGEGDKRLMMAHEFLAESVKNFPKTNLQVKE